MDSRAGTRRTLRQRRRRTAARLCFVAAAIVLTIGAASNWFAVGVRGIVALFGGCVVIPFDPDMSDVRLFYLDLRPLPVAEREQSAWDDWLGGGLSDTVHIPIWIPGACLILLGSALWFIGSRTVPGFCRKCSYDLTGNTSGHCPECGAPFERSGPKERGE